MQSLKPRVQFRHNNLLKNILFLISTLLLWISPITNAHHIQVQNLINKGGYQIIKLNEFPLIKNYSKIFHLINTTESENTINSIENNVFQIFDKTNNPLIIKQLEVQINKTRHNIKTLIPHRQKRGLMNFGGKIIKFLFGNLDEDDKTEITDHLKIIDSNNKLLIDNSNKQIRINNQVQDNLNILQNRINENQALMKNFLKDSNSLLSKSIQNLQMLSIYSDINILNSEIDKIQQNILFAKHDIMTHSILSNEEIDDFQIDINKYKEIKSSLLSVDSNIIFVLLIPNMFQNSAVRYKVLPLPNSQFEEINIEPTSVIKFNNKSYIDTETKNFAKFKETTGCLNSLMFNNLTYCSKRKNTKFEIFEISSNLILCKNAENIILTSDCNEVEFKLSQNNIITFENCTIKLNDSIMFKNLERIVKNHVILPNYLEIYHLNFSLNFEDINLKQIENLENIEKIDYYVKINFYIIAILIILTISLIIIFVIIKLYKKNKNVKAINSERINKKVASESSNLSGWGVIYPTVTQNKNKNVKSRCNEMPPLPIA